MKLPGNLNMSVGHGNYGLIILGSIIIIGVIFLVAGSIAGSYLLMIHYVHAQQAAIHMAQVKASSVAHAAAVKGATGTCKAVQAMDAASHGATNASQLTNSYGHKLALAIHNLYIHSGCAHLLGG